MILELNKKLREANAKSAKLQIDLGAKNAMVAGLETKLKKEHESYQKQLFELQVICMLRLLSFRYGELYILPHELQQEKRKLAEANFQKATKTLKGVQQQASQLVATTPAAAVRTDATSTSSSSGRKRNAAAAMDISDDSPAATEQQKLLELLIIKKVYVVRIYLCHHHVIINANSTAVDCFF